MYAKCGEALNGLLWSVIHPKNQQLVIKGDECHIHQLVHELVDFFHRIVVILRPQGGAEVAVKCSFLY
ncbi:hypothetical protein BOO22_10715 [Vibrio cidicii]|nr:hypothetical protein [Vibrio cidicii]